MTDSRGTTHRLLQNDARSLTGIQMFKRIRIAVLLYILLFVAVGEFLTSRRAVSWDDSLWVDIYLLGSTSSATSQSYIDALEPDAFAGIERFFAQQASFYRLDLDSPFRIRVAGQLDRQPPLVPRDGGVVSTIIWSLRMRWFATRLQWESDGPSPDITVFAIYHDTDSNLAIDRSTALRKGMIAVANLYGAHSAHGSNQMVVAHELLHTLGATDKYDRATGLPLFPIGFAAPELEPLYPQRRAELMGGRIAISAGQASVPHSLAQVVIGPETALEIGWTDPS